MLNRTFPRVETISADEMDYILRHIDHFTLKDSIEDKGKGKRGQITGYLKEFKEAQ